MSLINLEEVSGTIVIQNKVFSAKDVLGAVIRESVPVEFREGTLAIGIERIYPLRVTNPRDLLSSQMEECPLILREIAQIKREMAQINNALHLGREVEQSGTTEEQRRGQFWEVNSSDPRNTHRNHTGARNPVPPIPFPELGNEDLFDLFGDPEGGDSRGGFLRTQKKCEKCGQILPKTAKFCNVCGSPSRGVSTGHKNQESRGSSIPR